MDKEQRKKAIRRQRINVGLTVIPVILPFIVGGFHFMDYNASGFQLILNFTKAALSRVKFLMRTDPVLLWGYLAFWVGVALLLIFKIYSKKK